MFKLLRSFSHSLVSALLFAAMHASTAWASTTSKPNIILIFVDDLGYGDIGANGNTLIKTPNIDAIAAGGVRLTDFHASANVCTPSRAGLLTGRYPVRAGLGKKVVFPASTHGLKTEEITLAEILKKAGYATAMFGKWHLGHQPGMLPTDQGFDQYIGVPYSHDMKPLPLMNGKKIISETVDLRGLTRRFTDDAISFMKNAGDKPFFVYLPYTSPHEPLLTEKAFERHSNAGQYGDVVEELDHHIGRLLDAVKNQKENENTLVIFTSDNGPWWEGSAGPHDGRKGEQKDGAYRVPFVAKWPAKIPAGTVSDAMAMNIDLLPTLAAFAGATLPDTLELDGKDIVSLLLGGEKSPHESLYFFNQGDLAAIRSEKHRFLLETNYSGIRIPLAKFGKFLLYDLENGPEHYSVARDNMDVVAKFLREWKHVDEVFGAIPQELTGIPKFPDMSKLPIPEIPEIPEK